LFPPSSISLIHLPDQGIDLVFTVTKVTAQVVGGELAGPEATVGVAKLERPQEVRNLLEVGAHVHYLVNNVLHADDAVFAEVLLDDGIVGKRNALGEAAFVGLDLAVSTLVDKLTDALKVRVSVSNVGLGDSEHLKSGLGQADKDTRIDLEKTKELESLALLRVNLVDTVIELVLFAARDTRELTP